MISEIAVAVALAVMALLMVRTFASLRAVDLGFTSEGVLALRVALPTVNYESPSRQRAFFEELTSRVGQLPGVLSAGIISSRPLAGVGPATLARDASRPPAPAGQDPVVDVRYVGGDLFSALAMTIQAGTPFEARQALQ